MTVVLLLAIYATGCMAVHGPQPLSPAERLPLADLPRISVCFDSPLPVAEGADEADVEQARLDVASQVEIFRLTGLFSRVTVSGVQDSDCDASLIARELPLPFDWLDLVLFPVAGVGSMTLSLVPMVLRDNLPVRFSVEGAPDEELSFDCRTWNVMWFPLAAAIAFLPGWKPAHAQDTIVRSTAAECSDGLALFLCENRAQIWPGGELTP